MKRLFRILHWQARARYWKSRALKADLTLVLERARFESELKTATDALNAEMWRNREREDTFVSATVMGSRLMYGVPPRSAPALPKSVGASSTVPKSYDPQWDSLSWPDKAEFETSWKPLALAQGYTETQARQHFLAELANRRTLNDDGAPN